MNILQRRSTHASHLERWLGCEQSEHISQQFKNWYGPPVAVVGVPGNVFVQGGGDYVGNINAGRFTSMAEVHYDRIKRASKNLAREAALTHGAGFSSLSNMISQWTQNNKGQQLWFNKSATVTPAAGRMATSWYLAGKPGAGSAGAAAPGGTVHAKGDTGSYPIINTVTGSEGLFIVSGFASNQAVGGSLLLYDRLFSCAKTMSSSASQAVTGVPTRYTSTTSTDWNYAGGNFMVPEVNSALSATAHNWTVMQYTDQDGNTAQTAPSIAGVASAAAGTVDLAVGNWFTPLAANDIGMTALTQMQCSAAALTGGVTWVVGHPLAIMPVWTSNGFTPADFTNSAFGVVRMYDTACLATMWMAYNTTAFQPSLNLNLLAG
jgi:hypothetical protein